MTTGKQNQVKRKKKKRTPLARGKRKTLRGKEYHHESTSGFLKRVLRGHKKLFRRFRLPLGVVKSSEKRHYSLSSSFMNLSQNEKVKTVIR